MFLDQQLADGLTKDSMRQQLADKLRRGRIGIKFIYDPKYVAAKKKSLQEAGGGINDSKSKYQEEEAAIWIAH